MPSKLRSETARKNGAKSRGPVTEAGKRASSLNAIKHGIHSAQVVLFSEEQEQYDRLLAGYLQRFQPADPVEEALVMDMVNARWRLHRIQHLETAILDLQVDAVLDNPELPDETPAAHVCALAYQVVTNNSRALADLHRHEARLHRTYHRSFEMLRTLQAGRRAAEEADASKAAPQPAASEPEVAKIEKCENEPNSDQPSPLQELTDTPWDPSSPVTGDGPSPEPPRKPFGPPPGEWSNPSSASNGIVRR